jgi:hypothetical protein
MNLSSNFDIDCPKQSQNQLLEHFLLYVVLKANKYIIIGKARMSKMWVIWTEKSIVMPLLSQTA